MNKRLFIKSIRGGLPVVIAIVLLFLIYRKIDLRTWIGELRNIKESWFLILIVLGLTQSLISSIGWQISLSVINIRINLGRLFYYYLIGGFISLFLPGTIGGDAAKLVLVGNNGKRYRESFIALLIQRIIGLFVAITLLLIPIIVITPLIDKKGLKLLLLFLSIIFSTLILSLILSKRLSVGFTKFIHFLRIKPLNSFLIKILNIFLVYRDYPKKVLLIGLTSFAFQLLSLVFRYFILLALEIDINFIEFITIVVIVSLIVQIPISFAGLGIREGSYVYLYSLVGVIPEKALVFSLLEFIPGLLINSSSIVVYLVATFIRKRKSS